MSYHHRAILFLPIIEWTFRRQRPQQLARCFARAGWRVYYPRLRLAAQAEPPQLVESGIWQLTLAGDPELDPYQRPLSAADAASALSSLQGLPPAHDLRGCWVVAQLPGWRALAEAARAAFGGALLFDCMDDFSSFGDHADLGSEERALAVAADLVTVTAEALHAKLAPASRRCRIVRNGCDPEHFGPAIARPRPGRRPVVGFFGGIHDWFDGPLVAALARRRPEWNFWLVGDTYRGNVEELRALSNVRFWGELSYAGLPRVASWFDVGLIPFVRTPLTLATNPVKVYEMLAAGLPVVAVDLPELRPLQPLVALGEGVDELEALLAAALAEEPVLRQRRREVALQHSWVERFLELRAAMAEAAPQVGAEVALEPDGSGEAVFDAALEPGRLGRSAADRDEENARLLALAESLVEQRDRVHAEAERLAGELQRVEGERLAGERALHAIHTSRSWRIATAM
ncbi:MAG TPA: glycosyltransferase, partial [Thermoanaerobaculia bacterium]|nr:glycosyltransferase [Thermoanaerobaculia bacterium]